MTNSTGWLSAGEHDLRIELEHIDVTGFGPKLNPYWKMVDAAGHGHFYDHPGEQYPTLREITEPAWDEDGEYEAHVRWECPHCGEHIEPGTKPGMTRETIPGMKRYYVDGREVDRKTFLEIYRPFRQGELEEELGRI
jgi:hypothetical protein